MTEEKKNEQVEQQGGEESWDDVEKDLASFQEENKFLISSFKDLVSRMDSRKDLRDKEPILADEVLPLIQMMLEQNEKISRIAEALLDDSGDFDDEDDLPPVRGPQGVPTPQGQPGSPDDENFLEVSERILMQASELLRVTGFDIPSGTEVEGREFIENGFAARRMFLDLLADVEPESVIPTMVALSKSYPAIDIFQEMGFTPEQKQQFTQAFEASQAQAPQSTGG